MKPVKPQIRIPFNKDIPRPDRRHFLKACAGAATLAISQPTLIAQANSNQPTKAYSRVRLVDPRGNPIRSESLAENESYIFHYPYVSTPCFLINIGKLTPGGALLADARNKPYEWTGGVGKLRSVVAFSAICTHKMSYPTRSLSFINYRPEPVHYRDQESEFQEKSQLIYCCSERSAYDPSDGARVLGGPATQPLTTIVLEHDPETDEYYATGTRGGEIYEAFFEKFGFRLAMDYKINDIAEPAEKETTVLPRQAFSSQIVSC